MNGHRCSIRKNQGGCGTVKHLNGPCNKGDEDKKPELNFKVFIVDHVDELGDTDEERKFADKQLCHLERYWQAMQGTVYNGMNGTPDWHNTSDNRRNWLKELRAQEATIVVRRRLGFRKGGAREYRGNEKPKVAVRHRPLAARKD